MERVLVFNKSIGYEFQRKIISGMYLSLIAKNTTTFNRNVNIFSTPYSVIQHNALQNALLHINL